MVVFVILNSTKDAIQQDTILSMISGEDHDVGDRGKAVQKSRY